MFERKVVITGMGAIGPGFNNVKELEELLMTGEVACRKIDRFCIEGFKSKLAFQVDLSSLDEKDDMQEPLIVRYGRIALKQAKDSAKLSISQKAKAPFCVLGTAVASSWDMEACYGSLETYTSTPVLNKDSRSSISFTVPATRIFKDDTRSVPCVIPTGCTAGLDALGVAWTRILQGEDRALVVASEAPLTPMVLASFERIGALTKETEDRFSGSIPFCLDRSGFCIGEGAAAIILEEETSAKKRGAEIYGYLESYYTTSSAFHMTSIEPSGEAIYRSLEGALKIAGVGPEEVNYISPHATSTKQNDISEYNALRKVFDNIQHIPLFCGKSYFGHALGASNLIEVVSTLILLNKRIAAPYPKKDIRKIEYENLNLPSKAIDLVGNVAIKNSNGFSGIHSAIVLKGNK